jgi:glutaredoxin-like protein
MSKSREGQKVPAVTFPVQVNGEWIKRSSEAIFAGKTVALFALPGAFTPTCSTSHLPRFSELAATLKANGVDSVVCLAVNDPFVMETWKHAQHAEGIDFLPDGNAEFTTGMGLLVDHTDIGLGHRSRRYSMLVKNGVIEKMFVEADEPGDPYQVSDADTLLHYINPKAIAPPRITFFSKPGCAHCARARKMLQEKGLRFEEISLGSPGISISSMWAVSGHGTTPQVFIDGKRIAGADELALWLAK